MKKLRLAELLKPRLSYTDLARAYGCTVGFVSQIASGRRSAPLRFKLLCAHKLGLPVSYIFGEEGDHNHDQP